MNDYNIKKFSKGAKIDWDNVEKAYIDNAPWKETYPTFCKSFGQLAAKDEGLFVRLVSFEKEPIREAIIDNSDVYCDSCLEFFIKPNEDSDTYFNFECNSLGVMLAASGTGRENRKSVEMLTTYKEKFGIEAVISENSWEINYFIPFSLIGELKGARGNFYKCLEREKSRIHFQCWNNIETERPDFHRPEFFGELGVRS